jgi:hypothetical protein
MKNIVKFLVLMCVALTASNSYADSTCSNMVGQWKIHFVAKDGSGNYDFIFYVNSMTQTPDKLHYYESNITSARTTDGSITLASDIPSKELCLPAGGNNVLLQYQWTSADQEILQLVPASIDPTQTNMITNPNALVFTHKNDRVTAGSGSYVQKLA